MSHELIQRAPILLIVIHNDELQLLTQIYEFKGKNKPHIVSYCAGEKFSVSRDLRYSLVSEFADAIEYISIPA